jgi:transmembrane sensor
MMRSVEQDFAPDAAFWVARMDSGQWSAPDEAGLTAWIGEDPARHADLLRTQAAWLAATADPAETAAPEIDEAPPLWERRRLLAACVAGTIALAGGAYMLPRAEDYATNVGEIRRIPLTDGSVVIINSASELSVNLRSSLREIELAKGEAWFDVAKDPTRPFVVMAGNVRAQAVGTAFSVRRRDDGVEVNVTEGVVQTSSLDHQDKPLRLAAGSRVLISRHAVIYLEGGDGATNENALAWRSGLINLSGTNLAQAASEFNRYNVVQIVITDPRIANVEMAGIFRVSDPHGFVAAVRNTLDIRVDESNPGEIRLEAIGNGAN